MNIGKSLILAGLLAFAPALAMSQPAMAQNEAAVAAAPVDSAAASNAAVPRRLLKRLLPPHA
jgi:cytochrome c oxidase subunit II